MLNQKKYPAYAKDCNECVYFRNDNDEGKCPRYGFDKLSPYTLNCNAD